MTTTPSAIRDRLAAIITALTPLTESGVGFREHKHETQDLREFADHEPNACFRVFSVRYSGDGGQPEVSDMVVESDERAVEIVIAYPTTNRWGDTLDRDDVIEQDRKLVSNAVGTNSYGDVPEATMLTDGWAREDGSPATFLVLDVTAVYYLAQSA